MAEKRDYYEVLGVERTATDEEIKIMERLEANDFASPAEEIELISRLRKPVKDLDIRLDTEETIGQVTNLPPELRFSIGKPQKSGYGACIKGCDCR